LCYNFYNSYFIRKIEEIIIARKRKNKNSNTAIAVLILFVIYIISVIVQFISENSETFLNIIIIILIVLVLILALRGYLYYSKLEDYKKSAYFKDTGLPYKILRSNAGLRFEADVYNALRIRFPESPLLTNLLIARKGSINEYSEIDLIFFHQTGIYVLELKNYNGFIYGDMNKEYWTVGYKNETRTTYEFLNPILQNKKHIEDLQKVTSYQYINQVIFSDKTEIDSYIDNVSNFDTFKKQISKKESIYTIDELKQAYEDIKKINTYEKLGKHIERIKFNEQKYSQYRRK